MNTIKYIHPRSGNLIKVRVKQPSFTGGWGRGLTMSQADAQMARGGYVRAGRRWAGKAARAALRNARLVAKLSGAKT